MKMFDLLTVSYGTFETAVVRYSFIAFINVSSSVYYTGYLPLLEGYFILDGLNIFNAVGKLL